MKEEERIREEVLLNQDEIIEAVVNVYPPPEPATDEQWQIYTDAVREAIAQAQLDQVLKDKRVHIEADNQDLPLVLNDSKDFNNAYRDIGEGYVQKYMLTPKDGKVWVKCKVKEEHNG